MAKGSRSAIFPVVHLSLDKRWDIAFGRTKAPGKALREFG